MPTFDIKCLVSGKDTAGAVAVFEEIVAPGAGPPRHIHRQQIEIFHVISGAIRFEIDGVPTDVGAGGAAAVPAGAVHTFKNVGDEPATIHFELMPADTSEEAFARLASEEIADPPSFFDHYGMDLVGPPL